MQICGSVTGLTKWKKHTYFTQNWGLVHYSEFILDEFPPLSCPTLTQISFSIVLHQLTASIHVCIVSNNMQICCHRKDFTCHSFKVLFFGRLGLNTWGAPLISSDFDAVTKENGATSTSTLSPISSLASCLCFSSLCNTPEPFSHLYVYTCGSHDTLKSARVGLFIKVNLQIMPGQFLWLEAALQDSPTNGCFLPAQNVTSSRFQCNQEKSMLIITSFILYIVHYYDYICKLLL